MHHFHSTFKLLGACFLFLSLSALNTTSAPSPLEQEPTALNTDGLYFAEFYDYIYRGHFEHLEMTREDMDFAMIFEQYLRGYGRQCAASLPADKVEILELVCAVENVTTNGYGIEISRYCVEWKWVGTGIYAKPDLLQAKKEVENLHKKDGLQKAMKMMTDPNALGNSVDIMHKSNGLKNDMSQIFRLNDCNGSALKRFEENLKLFARNKPSLRMKKASKYTEMKTSGGPTGAQNYSSLVNDLVKDQAKTWNFNQYVNNSISNININSKDEQGRPNELRANYSYQGFGNKANGWVRVTFTNGLPKCIYFFDFPNNCKTPNSNIVASYAQGGYGGN